MISLRDHPTDGVAAGHFTCDHCGEVITRASDAVVLMDYATPTTEEPRLLLVHRDRYGQARCHYALEQELRAQGHLTGWEEVRMVTRQLVRGLVGGSRAVGFAVDIHTRDVWLLRWIAAGMPVEPLPNQPKEWRFSPKDAELLADRLAKLAWDHKNTATEDDILLGDPNA